MPKKRWNTPSGRWECPRNRRACRPGGLCVGCTRAADAYVRENLVRATAVYCNMRHPSGFRCDRAPHDSDIHRNMVSSITWLTKDCVEVTADLETGQEVTA
jgi:hypothetical protein